MLVVTNPVCHTRATLIDGKHVTAYRFFSMRVAPGVRQIRLHCEARGKPGSAMDGDSRDIEVTLVAGRSYHIVANHDGEKCRLHLSETKDGPPMPVKDVAIK